MNNYFTAGHANWTCGHRHRSVVGAIQCRTRRQKEFLGVPEDIVVWEWQWDSAKADWTARRVCWANDMDLPLVEPKR